MAMVVYIHLLESPVSVSGLVGFFEWASFWMAYG